MHQRHCLLVGPQLYRPHCRNNVRAVYADSILRLDRGWRPSTRCLPISTSCPGRKPSHARALMATLHAARFCARAKHCWGSTLPSSHSPPHYGTTSVGQHMCLSACATVMTTHAQVRLSSTHARFQKFQLTVEVGPPHCKQDARRHPLFSSSRAWQLVHPAPAARAGGPPATRDTQKHSHRDGAVPIPNTNGAQQN